MKNNEQSDYVTRDSILKLLSDSDVASVSTAETGAKLSDGDEYVDLEQPHRGVQRALRATIKMGGVLPRKAVHEKTWSNILTQLQLRHATSASGQATMNQDDPQQHSAVAVYETHADAEAAIRALQQAGLDMKRLSIIGKDFHTEEHALGFYTSGDRMKFWGGRGAFWGSVWGMLFGSALFVIPAIGPLVAMGPIVGWIVGALEGAAVGGATGVLAAALTSIGLPNDSVVKYELDVKAGKFLVLARGTSDMIEHARAVLGTTGASQLTAHAA